MTLNKVRARFWIVRGRQIVKRVIYRCVICRRHQGKPLVSPAFTDLPKFLVATDFCFQSIGTLYVKDKTMHKAYVCVFTCATSRAIDLEITPDLQGATFIRALEPFIARRGYPRLLISYVEVIFVAEQYRTNFHITCGGWILRAIGSKY